MADPMIDTTREFSRLVTDLLSGQYVDKSSLLIAASAVLDEFTDGDERIPDLRRLAYKAMDYAVFEYDEYLQELKACAKAFNLACRLIRAENGT